MKKLFIALACAILMVSCEKEKFDGSKLTLHISGSTIYANIESNQTILKRSIEWKALRNDTIVDKNFNILQFEVEKECNTIQCMEKKKF
jgi:hypothetical protein